MNSLLSANHPVWLVARREIVTRARTRSAVVSTAALMAIIVIGCIILAAFTGGEDTERIGMVGGDEALTATIVAVGEASGQQIEIVTIPDAEDARNQVEAGDIDTVLIADAGGYEGLSKSGMAADTEGILRAAVAQHDLAGALSERGVDLATLPQAPVQFTTIEPVGEDEAQRIVVALVGSMLLITAVMTGGTMVAVGVVEEKTSRVVEILLAAIKPLHLLWGKIIGIGVIALAQVVLLGATALIAGTATGLLTLPGTAITMFAWVIVWFILGFLFFATLYAAAGAIVSRQEELSNSSTPLTILALAVIYAGVFGIQALDSTLIQVLTWIPPFSAVLMPIRIATGDTDLVQIVGTLVIMIVTCAIAAWLAARIYQRSVLRTGSRVQWSEMFTLVR